MFSSTAEYALRATVHLATRSPASCTSEEIARGTMVPPGYLIKVLQDLARAGLVKAQRGPNGGFTLLKPPDAITALDVVNAVDPIRRITVCPLGITSHGRNLCPMHRRLDDAIALVETALGESSLSELTDSRPRNACVFPLVNGRPLPKKPQSARKSKKP